ncbi:MAG: YdcF family protein [Nakamurella sp.]
MHVGRTLARYVAGALLLAVVITAGVTLRIVQFAQSTSVVDADAIIVLGAAQYNGRPSLVFRERLDHAAELYRSGAAPTIITTGGGQPGDSVSEGEAGARYLAGVGVPKTSVSAVPIGIDTLLSLRAAAAVAHKRGWDSVILVTDPWHMARSRAIARDLGLSVQTSPVAVGPATNPAIRVRYIARELAGFVFYRLVGGSSGSGSAVL